MERLLIVCTLPPPIHGSNVVNAFICNFDLSDVVVSKLVPLNYAQDISDIGTISIKKLLRFIGSCWRIQTAILTFKPNYVYFVPAVVGISFLRDCVFTLLFRINRLKIIYHLHGKGIQNRLDNPLYASIYRWFFKNTNVIHLSKLLFSDLRGLVLSDSLYALANGVVHEDLVENRTTEVSTPNILYLSNFVATKGVLDFLDACGILAKTDYKFNIFLAGMPSRDISLPCIEERIRELGLKGYVKHLGSAYGDEKRALLRKADIFAFPTYFDKECFPLVLLEALSYGIAIVTTDEGAIPEIIENGKTGLIAQKRNPKDLAEKIAQLLNAQELRVFLGRNGRTKFLGHYTIDKFQQNFREIIGRIVQSGN